jgi:hypothetical protein
VAQYDSEVGAHQPIQLDWDIPKIDPVIMRTQMRTMVLEYAHLHLPQKMSK